VSEELAVVEHDGKFLVPKPSQGQRYAIVLAPGYYIANENWFRNGTSVLTIKRIEHAAARALIPK
jgi:hypothetical protein